MNNKWVIFLDILHIIIATAILVLYILKTSLLFDLILPFYFFSIVLCKTILDINLIVK